MFWSISDEGEEVRDRKCWGYNVSMWMYGDGVDKNSGVVDVKRHREEEVIHLQVGKNKLRVLELSRTQRPVGAEQVWSAGPLFLCPSGTLRGAPVQVPRWPLRQQLGVDINTNHQLKIISVLYFLASPHHWHWLNKVSFKRHKDLQRLLNLDKMPRSLTLDKLGAVFTDIFLTW